MHWNNKIKKFHPVLILLTTIFLIFGYGIQILIFLLALTLHEISHAFVARWFGYKLTNFYLMPYGACLSYESQFLEKEEICIALAGPLANLLFALFFIAIWWILPETYNITWYFVQSNFYLALFNFLPCYPLDFGRIIKAIIKDRTSDKLSVKVSKISSGIFAFIFFVLFVASCFVDINLNFMMISIILFFGIFDSKFQGQYEKIINNKKQFLNKGIAVKSLAIDGDMTLLKILRKISSTKYYVIYIIEDTKVTLVTETKLVKLCQQYDLSTKISDVLSIN